MNKKTTTSVIPRTRPFFSDRYHFKPCWRRCIADIIRATDTTPDCYIVLGRVVEMTETGRIGPYLSIFFFRPVDPVRTLHGMKTYEKNLLYCVRPV